MSTFQFSHRSHIWLCLFHLVLNIRIANLWDLRSYMFKTRIQIFHAYNMQLSVLLEVSRKIMDVVMVLMTVIFVCQRVLTNRLVKVHDLLFLIWLAMWVSPLLLDRNQLFKQTNIVRAVTSIFSWNMALNKLKKHIIKLNQSCPTSQRIIVLIRFLCHRVLTIRNEYRNRQVK